MEALKQRPHQESNSTMAIAYRRGHVISLKDSHTKFSKLVAKYHSTEIFNGKSTAAKNRIKLIDTVLVKAIIYKLGYDLNRANRTNIGLLDTGLFKVKVSAAFLNKIISSKDFQEMIASEEEKNTTRSRQDYENAKVIVSEKTINRRMRHLSSLGLLKTDKYGAQNRYFLNPYFVVFTEEREEMLEFLSAEYQLLENTIGTNCPLYKNSKRIISLLTSNVNMLISPKTDEGKTLLPTVDSNQIQNFLKEPKTSVSNDLANGNSKKRSSAAPKLSKGKEDQRQFIQNFALQMMMWMLEHLYYPAIEDGKLEYIAESEKQVIYDYFYNEAYTMKNWNQLNNFTKDSLKRLKKWEKFTKNEKTKGGFTPIPSYFFNDINLKGFAITKFWLKKDHQKRVWLKQNTATDDVLREIEHVLNGKQNTSIHLGNGKVKVINRALNYKEVLAFIHQSTDKVERYCSRQQRPDLLIQYRTKLEAITTNFDWTKLTEWQPTNKFEKQATELKNESLKINYRKENEPKQEETTSSSDEKGAVRQDMSKIFGLFR